MIGSGVLKKNHIPAAAVLRTRTVTSTTTVMTTGRGVRALLRAGAYPALGAGVRARGAGGAWGTARWTRAIWTAGSEEARSQSTSSG